MSDTKKLRDVVDLNDDIEYKLEKINAIVQTINEEMFDVDTISPDVITQATESGKKQCTKILCAYDTTKLFLGILQDYIWSSEDMLKEQHQAISEIQEALSAAKTVM